MPQFILITGGSKGIGLELARAFASRGYSLVLSSRKQEHLDNAATTIKTDYQVEILTVPCDLSDDSGPEQLFNAVKGNSITIHTLVNNAGVGIYGEFTKISAPAESRMMHLNINSLVTLTRLFIGDILKSRGGILNVASTAAFQPGPLMAVYYASKAFVLSFSEALHEELKEEGVKVSVLCPGPTRSEFYSAGDIDNTRLLKSGIMRMMSTSAVAEAGYKGYISGQRVIIPGIMNQLGALAAKAAPRWLAARFIHFVNQQRR